jgi:hypothetical protein
MSDHSKCSGRGDHTVAQQCDNDHISTPSSRTKEDGARFGFFALQVEDFLNTIMEDT